MKKEHIGWIAAIAIGLVACAWIRWTTRTPIITPEQKTYVEIMPERALFDKTNIRVIISARLRPHAPVSSIDFVHVGGYFIDQTGTSYTPSFSEVNNRGLPTLHDIQPWQKHILRTGEIYRYCLGPASIAVDDSSEEAAAHAITSATVYLDGLRPIEVPVRRWRDLE